MTRFTILAAALLLASAAAAGGQTTAEEHQALRERIEARFDVVPLGDGIALRPKTRTADVRLIEVTDVIAINGVAVSGQELRQKLGRDADHVLRLSYLDAATRRELFAERRTDAQLERPSEPGQPPTPVLPGPPPLPDLPQRDDDMRRHRRSGGERVRVFGDVTVREDEHLSGQAVAVIGSVKIDGTVDDQVVAVLGSVHLGPKAIVTGDVVSVGGRVHRHPSSQVRGGVTEVSLGDARLHGPFGTPGPWFGGGPTFMFPFMFGATSRLAGTVMRMCLLMVLAGIVVLLGRRTVEAAAARVSDDPGKSTLVGITAIVLIGPVMLLTSLVLALTIIGIPILFLLLPFVILALIVFAVVDFTASAYAVGQWARRRFAFTGPAVFIDIVLGIVIILLPLLLGRLMGFGGWPIAPIAMLLIVTGVAVEFIAWSSGFGAVLTNAFGGWQARRGARTTVVAPSAP